MGLDPWWEPPSVALSSPSDPSLARSSQASKPTAWIFRCLSGPPVFMGYDEAYLEQYLCSFNQAARYRLQFVPPDASEQPFPVAKRAEIVPVGFLACSSHKVISSLGSQEARCSCVLPQEHVEMFFYRRRTRHMVAWAKSPIFLQPFWKTGLF